MAYKSGMFNSVNGDRRYEAGFFAEYFASFIGNGVFPNPSTGLQVIANGNLTVNIKAGKAWINGYYFHNDSDHTITLSVADGTLKRIDRIVLRLDLAARTIVPSVKKGVFGSSPVAPVLQRDADAYELGLADILINNGTVNITQANITDTRLNPALCGIVHGVVDQVDTTTLFNQYQSWINQQKAIYETDLDNWTAEQQEEFLLWRNTETTDFNSWQAQEKADFENWVATLEGILSGDVAGNLQLQIEAVDVAINEHSEENASTSQKGHVQLSNDTNSDSETLAATPKAVKALATSISTTIANMPKIVTVSYIGNGSATARTISLPFTPKHFRIIGSNGSSGDNYIIESFLDMSFRFISNGIYRTATDYARRTTNGIIVNGTNSGSAMMNVNGETYHYIAVG